MITTHILDTARGRPAANVTIDLERLEGSTWSPIGTGSTDDDGRLKTLTPPGPVPPATYRLRFHTAAYFAAQSQQGFFPVVEIQFQIVDGAAHYHVPLLLQPFGYSTYRGS